MIEKVAIRDMKYARPRDKSRAYYYFMMPI